MPGSSTGAVKIIVFQRRRRRPPAAVSFGGTLGSRDAVHHRADIPISRSRAFATSRLALVSCNRYGTRLWNCLRSSGLYLHGICEDFLSCKPACVANSKWKNIINILYNFSSLTKILTHTSKYTIKNLILVRKIQL